MAKMTLREQLESLEVDYNDLHRDVWVLLDIITDQHALGHMGPFHMCRLRMCETAREMMQDYPWTSGDALKTAQTA